MDRYYERINTVRSNVSQHTHINTGENSAGFRLVNYYINNSNENITVFHRSNVPITIEREPDGLIAHHRNFIIRTIYKFSSSKRIFSLYKYFESMSDEKTNEMSIIYEVIKRHMEIHGSNSGILDIVIDKTIDVQELVDKKYMYVEDADIMLQLGYPDHTVHHPFTSKGLNLYAFSEQMKSTRYSGILVQIIDNENHIGHRYMYAGNEVVTIKPRKDLTKESGCYVVHLENNNLDDPDVRFDYCDFEEMDSLGIYRKKEEALTKGDPSLLRKEKLSERDYERAVNLLEAEKLKQKSQERADFYEERSVERKDHYEEKSNQRKDHYEETSNSRKDYYDERSYQRKDDSEWFKYVTGMLVGALTVGAVILKSK